LQKNISRFQFGVLIQNFIPFLRNIRNGQFVYTGAAGYRAVQGEIQKKPRGGSRGVMTRSLSGR
jgi:predicted Zn-dependent protease